MKRLPRILTVIFFLIYCSINVSAQQSFQVRGTVTDLEGVPVTGASVQLKNGKIGSSTDSSGNFSISVPDANGILLVSSVSFTPQEINIRNRLNLTIRLSPSSNTE